MEPKGNSMNIDDKNPQLNLEQSAVSLLDNKAKLSLYKKSSETGIPINVLEEVFMRGFSSWDGDFGRSPVQLGFNRVNSFVAGGYAARLDEDLREASADLAGQMADEKRKQKKEYQVPKKSDFRLSNFDWVNREVHSAHKHDKLPELMSNIKDVHLKHIHKKNYLYKHDENLQKAVAHHSHEEMKNRNLLEDLKKACWKGYEAVGMKEKNGKKVPNCVPVKEGIVDNPMQKPELTKKISKGLGDINNRGIGQAIARGFGKNAPQPIQNMKNPMKKESVEEATYQGREVKLNTPMAGDVKKSKVFVKDPSTGNIKKVNFGDKNMSIKKDQPNRKKSYCARSGGQGNLSNKTSANYWSRKAWNCSEENIEENKLLSRKTPSDTQISKKFHVPVSKVDKSIDQGTKVEKEHTKSNKLAKEIAKDHLGERPDYYKRLAKMEKMPIMKEEEYPTTKTKLLDGTKARTDWLKASTPGQSSITKTIKKVVKESLVDGDHNV